MAVFDPQNEQSHIARNYSAGDGWVAGFQSLAASAGSGAGQSAAKDGGSGVGLRHQRTVSVKAAADHRARKSLKPTAFD